MMTKAPAALHNLTLEVKARQLSTAVQSASLADVVILWDHLAQQPCHHPIQELYQIQRLLRPDA
jgi:hypothetical protein